MKKFLTWSLMIMLMAVGFFFTACGYTKKDVVVTASYSGMENGYLSLVVGQQAAVEFTVSKLPSNYSSNLIFSKNSNCISTPILESHDNQTGKSVVTFNALAKGEEIYLKAIADGGNYFELHIVVTLPVTDFSLKSDVNLFAVRGKTNPQILQLDSSIFNFYPSETSQKEIIFKDENGNEITEINANDFLDDNQITIKATSPYISKIADLTISLINEIASVDVYDGEIIENNLLTSQQQATTEQAQTDIIFITNRQALSRKTIKVVIPDNENSLLRIDRKIVYQDYLQCSDFDISTRLTENGDTIFQFELQSLQEGSTTISFDVYYFGYENYKITRTFEVLIKNAPDQIRMNDIEQEDNVIQTLFDGAYSTVYVTEYLSIIPTTAIYDKIEVSYDLSALVSEQNTNPVINDYINFTMGGNGLTDKITNFTSPIIAKGVKSTNGETIYMVISVYWGEEYNIQHDEEYLEYRLGFEVKTGASALLMQEEYKSTNGIYLENNGVAKYFYGLYVAQLEAYTDNITIYPLSQGAGLYAQVEAYDTIEENNQKIIALKITPLSSGNGKWRIMLPNGVYRDLTITVIPEVQSFKMDYDENNSSLTSLREYDDNNSLSKLGVKLTKSGTSYVASVQLKFLVNPSNYNFKNTALAKFSYEVTDIANPVIKFDLSTNILSISTDINGFSSNVFTFYLTIYKVDDFNLVTTSDNVFTGSLAITAYLPLTKVSFTQSEVSSYSASQLGLNYKDLSETQLGLVYNPSDLSQIFTNILPSSQSGNIQISLSSSKSYHIDGNTIIIENYGTYNFETGILTVDVLGSNYDSFYIYARVSYYNEIYLATLKVTPKFYQTVSGVYLSNDLPVDSDTNLPYIYLSPTHAEQEIFTYVSPENAVHKDLSYTFEPDLGNSGSLVRIETTSNNGIKVIYNNEFSEINNGGSGILYISPLASMTDTSSYPDNSLRIKVIIGAGTEENPFIISTATELLNIATSGNDKYYVITNIIDMSNTNFTSLGQFSGQIDGEGVGKIIGLNITKQIWNSEKTKTYSGLFTILSGTISNIIIEGSINLTASQTGSVGLVAGEISGTGKLQNVTVSLNQSTIIIATNSELRVGGVTGVNNGIIQNYIGGTYVINRFGEDTTYKYTNYPSIVMNGKFTLSYTLETQQSRSYFGGIAGVNEGDGIIERITVTNVKVYNNDNYTAVVNMSVEGAKSISTSAEQLNFSIGAIAGKNASKITASRLNELENLDSLNYYDYLKASGNIEIVQASNKLGGLVGENLGSNAVTENAVSRVKLRSSGTGNQQTAFLGGLFAYNRQGTIRNCLLQALEDGVSLGTAVSMIYSDSFGLTTGETPTLNGRVNVFGYDSNALAVQDKTDEFAVTNHLGYQTYIGAVAVNGILPQGKRAMVEKTTFGTFDNYYGDFLVVDFGKMFDEVDATLINHPANTVNRMQSEQNSFNMSYLQYYKTLDTTLQDYVADMNTYDFPFEFSGEINLYSFDQNIVSIGSDGKLTVHSTGLVKIRVLSTLNAKIYQDVFVYVVKAANNFSLYIQSVSDENEINYGRNISVKANQTLPLIVQFYLEPMEIGGKYVEFELSESYSIFNSLTYEGFVKKVDLIKIGSMYGLEAINIKGVTEFKLYARLNLAFNNEQYYSENLENINGQEVYARFLGSHISGATQMQSSVDEITVEPIDEFAFNILTTTDDFEDTLTLGQTKFEDNNVISGDYFDIAEINRIYLIKMSNNFPDEYYNNITNGQSVLKITQNNLTDNTPSSISLTLLFDKTNNLIKTSGMENFASTLSLSMQNYFTILNDKSYSYEFDIALIDELGAETSMLTGTAINSYIELVSMQNFFVANFNNAQFETNYQGEYYINASVSSTTEIVSTFIINMSTQSVGNIIVDSFTGSTSEDINSGKEQSNYLDPQSSNPNHLRISVYPLYADYDYINIVNETSSVTTLFTLINESGVNISGAVLISNGIKISKTNITDFLYVKYASSSSGVVNGQVLTFSVTAYKNGEIIFATNKYITIRFTKDVTFEITGKQAENEESTIYLTRGSTYDFTISSNGYLENEIYISTTRTDIISINKSARTIQVLTSFTYQTTTRVEISILGTKTVNGEVISSSPYTLSNIIVVDYYITSNGFSVISDDEINVPTDSYTPVKNGSNGIVSVGLGNSYTLSTEFLNNLTVEYYEGLSTVKSSLATFQNTLNKNATWEYKMGSLNTDNTYSYLSGWTPITSDIDKNETNGYFTITKTDSGYIFTPLKVTSTIIPAYIFRLSFGYDYLNGLAVINVNQNYNYYEFLFNIYQLSSIESPTPIYTAEEFSAMNEGTYYILMNDITLPSTFTPITNEISGFDGNNNKIILSNNITIDNLTYVGIFSSIASGSLIRNLNIEIANATRYTINQTSQSTIYVGVLAGQNNGIITNVSITTVSGASFRVVFASEYVGLNNYVGALVGINNGYITNSRVTISLTSSANISGFVAYNVGKISSSYVNKSLIINTSTESQNKTAGFVIYNDEVSSDGGKIINSYVSGLHTGTLTIPIYANDTSAVLRSSTEVAGFIYENDGEILNSYSDIPLQSSSKSAGFAFLNKGTISYSYSTSQLKSNSQESYGFVYNNTGTLTNNYFLKDENVNYSINTSNENMNTSYLKALTISEFSSSSNFTNFYFTTSTELTKGTWFMPLLSYESQFNNTNKVFVVGKPELVSANLVVSPKLEIDIERTSQDDVTGEITYFYNNSSQYSQGSLYNPYLLSTALEFENTIKNSNSGTLNTNNYRIIADIDYEEETITSSQLFNTVLLGDIEGNGMEIRGYIIDSSSSTTSSGLFAKIGNGTNGQGTVKNLVLKPKYINMPNSVIVGGLAGTLDSGILFNIKVDGFEYSNSGLVILGKNIVGGVIGRAIGNYKMTNIESSISTNSTYRSAYVLGETDSMIASYFLFRSQILSTLSRLSYSGAVVAVAGGTGQITNVTVSGLIASMGEFASLVFGGVGDGVVINNVDLTILQGQFVQAAVYGGLVSGEFYGRMSNVSVSGANEVTDLFKTIPFVPYAVGGLVGLMGSSNNLTTSFESKLGGYIENAFVNVSIKSTKIKIVGGLVGELIGGRSSSGITNVTSDVITSIKSSSFTGSLQSAEIVGGIIGRVSNKPTAEIGYNTTILGEGFNTDNNTYGYNLVNQVCVTGGTLKVVNENDGHASAGGIIGEISLTQSSNAILNVLNSYSTNAIEVKSDIFGAIFYIYAGGLVGKLEKLTSSEEIATANLNIKYSYFASSIALTLRDLMEEPVDSEIYYGKIVANTLNNFNVNGTNVYYKDVDDNISLTYLSNGTSQQEDSGLINETTLVN